MKHLDSWAASFGDCFMSFFSLVHISTFFLLFLLKRVLGGWAAAEVE